jgi:membrane protein implicated in regulation of membrane protease activity
MTMNLNDYLGQHLVWLWVIVAVMFVALELLRRDWLMVRLAACALVTALVALVFGHLWWLQLVVFAAAVVGTQVGATLRRRRTPVGGAPTDSV